MKIIIRPTRPDQTVIAAVSLKLCAGEIQYEY